MNLKVDSNGRLGLYNRRVKNINNRRKPVLNSGEAAPYRGPGARNIAALAKIPRKCVTSGYQLKFEIITTVIWAGMTGSRVIYP